MNRAAALYIVGSFLGLFAIVAWFFRLRRIACHLWWYEGRLQSGLSSR